MCARIACFIVWDCKCKNTENYQIKQEIRVFILNFGDYCLFYAVLDYSSLFWGIEEI